MKKKRITLRLLAAVAMILGALMLAQVEVSQIGAYGPCQSNNKITPSNITVKYAAEKNRGKLEDSQCDVVIHRECTTSSWHETGLDACMWSWTCIWGYYVEEEREVMCTYTCENGYMYTRTWTENEWHQKGCCWLGVPHSINEKEQPPTLNK